MPIIMGICRFARGANWQSLFTGSAPIDSNHGVIACVTSRMAALMPKVQALGIPLVNIGFVNTEPVSPQVIRDDAAIGRMCARYFLERRYHHLAMIAWGPRTWYAVQREAFFTTARTDGAHTHHIHLPLDPFASAKEDAMLVGHLCKALQRLPKPVALMASCDWHAEVMVHACKVAGIDIPRQVAILAYGDGQIDRELSPMPLSYVRHNLERQGYEAAAVLERMMNGEQPPSSPILVPPAGIVTRATTDAYDISHRGVRRALVYIDHAFASQISVSNIASAADMSHSSLYENFRRHLGCSVHEHLVRVRLDRARALLLDTDWSVERIAGESGFLLTENMRKVFVKEYGCPPREYRQKFGTLGI